MRKNDKKLIIILVILILILIIVIKVISGILTISDSSKDNENKNQYKDENLPTIYEKKGKYEPSVINSDYTILNETEIKSIDTRIDTVLDYINNKKYSEIYDKIDEQYKLIKFQSENNLKTYIDEKFSSNEYSCLSYRIKDDACYIRIKATREDSSTEIIVKSFRAEDNWFIYFDNIDKIQKVATQFDAYDVNVNMEYLINYEDKRSTYIILRNSANKEAEVTFKEILLTAVLNGTEIDAGGIEEQTIKVPAKGTKAIEIYFKEKDKLKVESAKFNMTVNGKEKTTEIFMWHPELEESEY